MSEKSSKKLIHKILSQIKPELSNSSFYNDEFMPVFKKTMQELGNRKIEHIVCYGLGSFHNGTEIASRYQLALLLLIYEYLTSNDSPIKGAIDIYDPSFEELDLMALSAFPAVKFNIIQQNEYCARRVKPTVENHMTLFYMPHLDKHFYNNILGANWYKDSIKALLVLGNSFQTMIDNEIISICKTKLYYINLLVNNFNRSKSFSTETSTKEEATALNELVVEINNIDHSDIFNNFAFHFINEAWLYVNKDKFEQHRKQGWEFDAGINSDNDWPDD